MNPPNTTDDPAVGPIDTGGPAFLWRRPTTLALTALCGAALLFYHRLWLPDLVLIKQDAYRFFLPMKRYMMERLLSGELPQWFPYESLGRPFLGIPHTGVFHPFTLLYFLLPETEAYRLSVLLSCLIGAGGAFALGRMLGFSRSGAVLAGAAFSCSGYVASMTENTVYIYSTCMLPLFCVSLRMALLDNVAWVVAPAVLWATVLLHGDIQSGYYYGFVAALVAVLQGWCPDRKAGLRLLGVGLLAGLLAAVQLAPAGALFVGSHRNDPAHFRAESTDYSTHPFRLLSVVAAPLSSPDDEVLVSHYFFGGRPPQETPVGYWAESLYMGLPVVGLACLGLRYRRDLRGIVVVGGLALVLALGKYGGLYDLLYQFLPLWSAFRFPEKLMAIVSCAVAILAGAGLDELRQGRGSPALWVGAAVILLLAGGVLQTSTAHTALASVLGAPGELTDKVAGSSAVACFFSAATASAGGLITAGVRQRRSHERLFCLLLIGVVLLDLSRVNQEAYHTGPAAAATFTPALAETIQRHAGVSGPGHFRILPFEYTYIAYPLAIRQSLDSSGITSVVNRQGLVVEHNADVHLESLGSYLPGRSQMLGELYATLRDDVGQSVYARYNVSYIIGQRELFQSPVFAGALLAAVPAYNLAVARNPVPVKPRAYVSRQPERAASPVALPVLLSRSDFLNGEVDVVESPDTDLPGPARDGQAVIERYAPEEVTIRVTSSQPAVLILLDAFEAGWTATLDRTTELPIRRANGLVRAVTVPSGSHAVTFAYRTPWLATGAVLSGVGLLLCGMVLIRRRGSVQAL